MSKNESPAKSLIGDAKSVNQLKTKLQIAEGIQRYKPLFEGVLDLMNFVKDMDSLERSFGEMSARKEKLDAERAEAETALLRVRQEVDAAHDTLKEVSAQVKAATAAVKSEPARIIAEARAQAVNIESAAREAAADAKREAEGLIAAAKAEAEQTKAQAKAAAQQIITEAHAAKEKVEVSIAERTAELETVTGNVKAKQAEHDDLQKKIDKLKAQAAKLLGV